MQFDFELHVGGNDWHGEDVCKVFGELNGVHSFDLSTGQFGKFAQLIEVALVSGDGDHVDRQGL